MVALTAEEVISPMPDWADGRNVIVSYRDASTGETSDYEAKVIESAPGMHKVHFIGYGKEHDEWIAEKDIREK